MSTFNTKLKRIKVFFVSVSLLSSFFIVSGAKGGALHEAVKVGDIKKLQSLIKAGVFKDLDARDFKGETPLHWATFMQKTKSIKLLLEAGADIDAKNHSGLSPLYLATYGVKIEILKLLIQSGANVNARDNNGRTPLHFVAYYEEIERLKLLIKAGADVDVKDNKGSTPLHIVAYWGQIKSIKALIEAGANVNARDFKGRTPLYIVKSAFLVVNRNQDYIDSIKLLLNNGGKL